MEITNSKGSEKLRRKSIRIPGYDYSKPGAYYVTICVQDRKCMFGDIVNGEMRMNEYGNVVQEEWLRTEEIRTYVELDESVVMPNHFHGILFVTYNCRGTARRAPTKERFGGPCCRSLPTIIRAFKSATTKRINEMRQTPSMTLWQRNYYEHVVRNEIELNELRQYIKNNPIQWELDKYYFKRSNCNVNL